MSGPAPVVFILSTRRAGSTWLNLVLGSCSWGANLGEYKRLFEDRGHVACRLCEAEGLPGCAVLHGVEHVDQRDAFAFATARLPGRVLFDASKRPEWARLFLGRDDVDARLVHLVRHPAGVMEGQRRRTGLSWDALLEDWELKNRAIEEFVASTGTPSMLVSYEDLTNDPERAFPALCAFAGGPFEPGALRYWEHEHHGLGGNGAASLYLRGRARVNYVTGDDAFYAELAGAPTRADTRWHDRVPADVALRAIDSPYAKELAARLGREWEHPAGRGGATRAANPAP